MTNPYSGKRKRGPYDPPDDFTFDGDDSELARALAAFFLGVLAGNIGHGRRRVRRALHRRDPCSQCPHVRGEHEKGAGCQAETDDGLCACTHFKGARRPHRSARRRRTTRLRRRVRSRRPQE